MSYDVTLTIHADACSVEDCEGVIVDDRNYTTNCAPMWRKAGCDLSLYDGKLARELAVTLGPAVADMTEHPEKYRPLNPPNGWGDVESATEWLAGLLHACEHFPDARLWVWA